MRTDVLEREQVVSAPLDEVFAFFSHTGSVTRSPLVRLVHWPTLFVGHDLARVFAFRHAAVRRLIERPPGLARG